jgi:diguanylate cyclase (GGDEF)-like protein
MNTTSQPPFETQPPPLPGSPEAPASAERWITELHSLLRDLEAISVSGQTLPPVFTEAIDDQLVRVRLGVAAGLFAALHCKNAAIAGHSLRVALVCSGWAVKLRLSEADCDSIEIAALLHDVGVIGAPDHILLKAGTLDDEEAALMAGARKKSLDILRRSCASPGILEIVENVSAWYDGSRAGFSWSGRRIPLGARMIAIVEAFDAMTTDHVYRPARSMERALSELFECSGSQFDPELVEQFVEFCGGDPTAARGEAARRWLQSLRPATVNSYWTLSSPWPPSIEPSVDAIFQGRLLDAMYDAVVFIDAAGRVVMWNRGAERLTGIMGDSVRGQFWHPSLLGLADEKGNAIGQTDCPVQTAIRCGAQSLRRLTILGQRRQAVAIDSHAIPVIDREGVTQGAVVLLHDASSETSLEQRCQSLHEKAIKDPLTQVANRAEFDRVHALFIAANQQQQVPCSLLMCDLDRFKRVNDTFGHQAGDETIKSLAALLKSSCRPGDLVARYGGEEFVVLYADCGNAAAARRAEEIRQAFSRLAQPKMHGRSVTVSIGVTEVQPGDTPETMLRRADRALLLAKSNGRNMVVQLGDGVRGEIDPDRINLRPIKRSRSWELFEQDLLTPVPARLAVEKLRGFVADHRARIVAVDDNQVQLEIEEKPTGRLRRLTDRPTTFRVDVRLEEERTREADKRAESASSVGATRTKIKVAIGVIEGRNRRHNDVAAKARKILISFRSYLMAVDADIALPSGVMTRVKRIITPWLGRT